MAHLQDLLEELQRRIGDFAIVCGSDEWTVYTPWGVIRDENLATACMIVLENMDAAGDQPIVMRQYPDEIIKPASRATYPLNHDRHGWSG